jgi:hypothetical protein
MAPRRQPLKHYATISITLLGLSYEYPEWHFANDIAMKMAGLVRCRMKFDAKNFSECPQRDNAWTSRQSKPSKFFVTA